MQCGAQFLAQQLPWGVLLNNRYRVGKLLGQGAFGMTYLCLDQQTGQRVAIKEYFPSDVAFRQGKDMWSASAEAEDQVIRGLEYFFDEVKVLMEFNQHPNIIRISDYFFENQTAYFVMDYLSGKTLKKRLAETQERVSYNEIHRILLPVMSALRDLHHAGLLHRDLAPDNIFLTDEGRPVLLDFGSARLTMSQSVIGSALTIKPGYAPVEQYFELSRQGPWTDIYQLGAVYYRALTGKIPPESIIRVREDRIVSPGKLGINLPEAADKAIMKALALDIEDRFEKMDEMILAFGEPVRELSVASAVLAEFSDISEKSTATRMMDANGMSGEPPQIWLKTVIYIVVIVLFMLTLFLLMK